jgi:hypothetical protein
MLYRFPRFTLCVLILFCCVVAGAVSAQEPEPVRTEVFEEKVPFGGTSVFRFTASEGDSLIITARALDRDFDPHMTVSTADGVAIASNDDHERPDPALMGVDSRISPLIIPATGDYVIQVGALNATGGRIEVKLEWEVDLGFMLRRESVIAADISEPISSETRTEMVNPYDKALYAFDGERGDVYTFIARRLSGDLDARIAIYLEDAILVAANDDSGSSDPSMGTSDALINNVILPERGRYYVEVRGYEGTSGNVAFTITQVARNALVYPGVDQVFAGSVQAWGSQDFRFTARVGDYVTITARAESVLLDPVILLSNSEGTALLDNDNHGSNASDLDFFDSRISNYLIRDSGTYVVTVASGQGGEGDFTLTVNIKRDRRLLDLAYQENTPDEASGS